MITLGAVVVVAALAGRWTIAREGTLRAGRRPGSGRDLANGRTIAGGRILRAGRGPRGGRDGSSWQALPRDLWVCHHVFLSPLAARHSPPAARHLWESISAMP